MAAADRGGLAAADGGGVATADKGGMAAAEIGGVAAASPGDGQSTMTAKLLELSGQGECCVGKQSQIENEHYSTVCGLIGLVIIISRMLYPCVPL